MNFSTNLFFVPAKYSKRLDLNQRMGQRNRSDGESEDLNLVAGICNVPNRLRRPSRLNLYQYVIFWVG